MAKTRRKPRSTYTPEGVKINNELKTRRKRCNSELHTRNGVEVNPEYFDTRDSDGNYLDRVGITGSRDGEIEGWNQPQEVVVMPIGSGLFGDELGVFSQIHNIEWNGLGFSDFIDPDTVRSGKGRARRNLDDLSPYELFVHLHSEGPEPLDDFALRGCVLFGAAS
jgi:hypothetical protein